MRLATAKIAQAMSTHSSPRSGHGQRSASVNPIALAPYRFYPLAADLGAQTADVNVDHVGAGVEVVTPDGGEDPLFGDRLSRIRHQFAQQEKLPLGQLHASEFTVRVPADQVEGEAADDESGRVRPCIPKPCPHSRQQLLDGEGLGEIIAGTELEGMDFG